MILEDMDSSVIGLGHDLIRNGVGIDCLPEDVIMKEPRRSRHAQSRESLFDLLDNTISKPVIPFYDATWLDSSMMDLDQFLSVEFWRVCTVGLSELELKILSKEIAINIGCVLCRSKKVTKVNHDI